MDYIEALEQYDRIIELLSKDQKLSPSYVLVLNALRNKLAKGAGEQKTKTTRK